MTRPNVSVPVIAQNDDYALGSGDPWDALPTKVDPGVFYQTQGFVPGADNRPSAQHMNFLCNAWARWIDYLRNVPIRNWSEYQGTLFNTNSIEGVGFIPSTRRFVFGQRNAGLRSSRDSFINFQKHNITTAGGQADYVRFLTGNDDKLMFTVGDDADNADPDVWLMEDTGVALNITRQALAPFSATFEANGILCDTNTSPVTWMIFGGISGVVRVYTSSDDGVNWSLRNVETGSPSAIEMIAAAHNNNTNTIIGIGPGAAAVTDMWISTNNGTSWSEYLDKKDSLNNSIDDRGRFLTYNSLLDTWMMVTTAADVYTSVDDGATWVKRTTIYNNLKLAKGVCCDGGSFFVMVERDEGSEIADVWVSHDSGVTWETIASLPSNGTDGSTDSTAPAPFQPLQFLGGRLVALFTDGTDGFLCFSQGT